MRQAQLIIVRDIFIRPIVLGGLATFLSIFLAARYFTSSMVMGACALIALGLGAVMQEYLEQNRRDIWDGQDTPFRVNRRLAIEIFGLFLGIFCCALGIFSWLPYEVSAIDLNSVFRNEFLSLLGFNLKVLVVGFLLSALYRGGGLVLILSWNAFDWALALSGYARSIAESFGVLQSLVLLLGLSPHLALEAISYVVAGMAGVFLSKAITKYAIRSEEFRRVWGACQWLLLVSLALLILSVLIEIWVAQPLFAVLSKN